MESKEVRKRRSTFEIMRRLFASSITSPSPPCPRYPHFSFLLRALCCVANERATSLFVKRFSRASRETEADANTLKRFVA